MLTEVLEEIGRFVWNKFNEDTPPYLLYHNLDHTTSVVRHCHKICHGSSQPLQSDQVLLIAAWFHDIGQLYTTPERHEIESVTIMRNFLDYRIDPELIGEIEELIMATKVPTHPETELEGFICDADTYHFGTDEFFRLDKLVEKELRLRTGRSFGDWNRRSLELLRQHRFYSAYCIEKLSVGKEKNIRILENLVAR